MSRPIKKAHREIKCKNTKKKSLQLGQKMKFFTLLLIRLIKYKKKKILKKYKELFYSDFYTSCLKPFNNVWLIMCIPNSLILVYEKLMRKM